MSCRHAAPRRDRPGNNAAWARWSRRFARQPAPAKASRHLHRRPKISHDLRGILSTAQLLSDRLADSTDPNVQRLAPTLIGFRSTARLALCADAATTRATIYATGSVRASCCTDWSTRPAAFSSAHPATRRAGTPPSPRISNIVADRDRFRVLVNLGATRSKRAPLPVGSRDRVGRQYPPRRHRQRPGLRSGARQFFSCRSTGSARRGGTGSRLAMPRRDHPWRPDHPVSPYADVRRSVSNCRACRARARRQLVCASFLFLGCCSRFNMGTHEHTWDPNLYLKFTDHRFGAAVDLLAPTGPSGYDSNSAAAGQRLPS